MYFTNRKQKQGICLICFKDLNNSSSLVSFFNTDNIICESCKKEFKVFNKIIDFYGIKVWVLYEYNTFMKHLIYQYKGCYDIALKDVFLYQFKSKIKKEYRGYTIVFPPSYIKDDEARGFKHIEEIAKTLNMKVLDLFNKTMKYKQSDHSYIDRKNIEKVIELKSRPDKNLKYLIIDDIFTSGSTLKTIIKLLVKNGVKKENIKALIIAKTVK